MRKSLMESWFRGGHSGQEVLHWNYRRRDVEKS
jgi:hypothetical protein